MKQNAKIFFWIALVLIVILVIYLINTTKKQVKGATQSNKPNPAPNNTGSTTTKTDASDAGIDTSAPAPTVTQASFNIGDKIYAGEDILNTYTKCSPSASTLLHTYSKGDYIGDYTRTDGVCIVASANLYRSLLGVIPIPAGSEDNYIVQNAKIYVKNT